MTEPTQREPSGSEADLSAVSPVPASSPAAGISLVPPNKSNPFWMFIGPQGLRTGWAVMLGAAMLIFFAICIGSVFSIIVSNGLHIKLARETAASAIVSESPVVLALAAALAILALVERRRFLDYYLADHAAAVRFTSGLISGFAALSALVGLLTLGGWVRFGPVPQYSGALLRHAALWAIAFVLVGLAEEGVFRCFLQFTMARGINFWWALTMVAAMCVWGMTHAAGHGAGGIYLMGALGVLPCLYLEWNKVHDRGFWQAAWAGSTAFGFIHTTNTGETWIGIFAAAAIGFVFCVSIRLTGSAWWAFGCHAAWDWAETYFYGTADSGFVASGHLFTTSPAGSAFWSGGTDGPEGSILVLPIILLILVILVLLYGRKREQFASVPVPEKMAG